MPRGRQQYDNNMTVTLFDNDKRRGDKDPHMQGKAEVDGVEYWANGWWNRSDSGVEYLKIKLQPKEEGNGRQASGNRSNQGRSTGMRGGGGNRGNGNRDDRNDRSSDSRSRSSAPVNRGQQGGGFDEMDDDIPF